MISTFWPFQVHGFGILTSPIRVWVNFIVFWGILVSLTCHLFCFSCQLQPPSCFTTSPNSPVCVWKRQLPFTNGHPLPLLMVTHTTGLTFELPEFPALKWDLLIVGTPKIKDIILCRNILFHWSLGINWKNRLITQFSQPLADHFENTKDSPKLVVPQLSKHFWANTPSCAEDNLFNLDSLSAFPLLGANCSIHSLYILFFCISWHHLGWLWSRGWGARRAWTRVLNMPQGLPIFFLFSIFYFFFSNLELQNLLYTNLAITWLNSQVLLRKRAPDGFIQYE